MNLTIFLQFSYRILMNIFKICKNSLTKTFVCDIFIAFQWYHRQAVRQRSAKPLFPGSNPGGTSKKSQEARWGFLCMRVWRNGRRTGLKILSSKGRVGSTPTTRTSKTHRKMCFLYLFAGSRTGIERVQWTDEAKCPGMKVANWQRRDSHHSHQLRI